MENLNNIILMKISGQDKPGLTASFAAILANYNATILDIGQADIHNTLSLGIMFKAEKQEDSGNILRDLLFKSYELEVHVKFIPISEDAYNEWVKRQGKNRYIITLLGKRITAQHIASVAEVIAGHELNIDAITRLSGRMSLNEEENENMRASVEMSVRGTLKDRANLQMQLMDIAQALRLDISFQEENLFRRSRRLICFDMDSTLIKTEVIDELADRAGVGEKVRAITEAAMRGEMDFNESFAQRVKLLKGLDESVMVDIAENLPIMDGADRLMSTLKKFGFKIAILSGGFTYFGNYLKQRFGADYLYANELEREDGKLTGNYIGEIVDGRRKAELMRLIAQVEDIDLQQVIAVGDGANDLPMINQAGLGIAFHAKPKVKENAKQSISNIGLDGVLYLLGYKDSLIQG
jgi:phosphoserine phosphatase